MTAVLRTLLDAFFVEYMNIHHLTGSYLEHNTGSKRVLEKCGFVFDSVLRDAVEVQETKTGVKWKRVSVCNMKWRR